MHKTAMLFLVTASAALAADKAAKAPAVSLDGTWASPACEAVPDGKGGKMFFKRTFKIAKGSWAIDFSTYGDEGCSEDKKMVTVDIDGPFKLDGASSKVTGATEAQFLFTHRKATPRSDGAAGWLTSIKACGHADWKAGTAVDIDKEGCPALGAYPKKACTGEFDLVKVEGDDLFFGSRPADGNLCSKDKRPTALGSPVHKI
jgi:hypothetical protein